MLESYISFSEYRLFESCQYKHFLSKVLKFQEPKNEFLIFGSSLHSAIEDIILKKTNKIAWGKVFEQKLKEESNDILMKSYFGRQFSYQGTAILKELNFFERFKDYEVVGVELEMYEPLQKDEVITLYFKGIIDLVLKKGDRYLILDWKSANTLWDLKKKFNLHETSKNVFEFREDPKDKSFFGQLALYKHFYSQKFNIPLDKIDTAFIALSRDPVNCQRYDIEISKAFQSFIVNDVTRVAREILLLDPNNLKKVKFEDKSACQYCFFKKDKSICDNEKKQVI